METTFMSYVARRKLNFQQLENAQGKPLPAVIKGYATLRDAKLAESSYDKVVMWTGGGPNGTLRKGGHSLHLLLFQGLSRVKG